MADYININGNNIPIRASDPTNPIEGEVWYNTTTNALKGQAVATADAWASGTNYPTNIRNQMGAGSQLAAVQMGGYNGTSYVAATNEYDGSAWTSSGALPAPQADGRAGGPQTDVIAAGGLVSGTNFQTTSLSYDGSTWSPTPSLNTGRDAMLGTSTNGSSTAFLIGGGQDSGTPPSFATTASEEYNGASWTSVNSMNTVRRRLAGAGANNTSGLAFAGKISLGPDPVTGATEVWNGTNWTEVGDMSVAREYLGSSGTNSSALGFGGNIPPSTTSTEEFNAGPATVSFGDA